MLVSHDYGVSVAQELLARRAEGRLALDLSALHLLNGGLYPDLHRPQPVQTALLDPQQGRNSAPRAPRSCSWLLRWPGLEAPDSVAAALLDAL